MRLKRAPLSFGLLAFALACLASPPALAWECKDLPASGQTSVTRKYMKIKAEGEHTAQDCEVRHTTRGTDSDTVAVRCRIHFRPRNGGCFVDHEPYGDPKTFLSRHPGCSASTWAWANHVDMRAGKSSTKPEEGEVFSGKVKFNMMKTEYELKYTVVTGTLTRPDPVTDTYTATLRSICIRKAD